MYRYRDSDIQEQSHNVVQSHKYRDRVEGSMYRVSDILEQRLYEIQENILQKAFDVLGYLKPEKSCSR